MAENSPLLVLLAHTPANLHSREAMLMHPSRIPVNPTLPILSSDEPGTGPFRRTTIADPRALVLRLP